MGGLAEFTDDNFESEVLKSSEPVFVDFWAPWCQPCRVLMPLIEQLAEENTGSIKFGKVNVDDNRATAEAYGVQNLPTLMIFKEGDVQERFMGMQPKARLQESLDKAKG